MEDLEDIPGQPTESTAASPNQYQRLGEEALREPTTIETEQLSRDAESAIQFLEMTLEVEPDATVPLLPGPLNMEEELGRDTFTPEELQAVLKEISGFLGEPRVPPLPTSEQIVQYPHPEYPDIALHGQLDPEGSPLFFLGKAGFWI